MREIYKVKEIIEKIATTSSKNDKKDILNQYKDNELFKKILKFVFDPYILTGISKKKITKKITTYDDGWGIRQNIIIEVIEYLLIHNTGKDIDIVVVQNFLNSQPEDLRELFTKIITKDLPIGISADTINKIFGDDFIPVFDVMLAKKYDDHKDKIKGNFVITKKLDGNRCVVIKENGIVKSFTRQGNQYEGLEEIESDISSLNFDNTVFDGELIADTEGSTHEVYAETTSKARSKGSNKKGLIFHIFDVLPLDEFQKGQSIDNCIDRKARLFKIFKEYDLPHCKEVEPLYIGSDINKVDELFKSALNEGWEGLILNLDKPYMCKRTGAILKVKAMSTCDLKVIGFEEGSNKNEGRLGALLVDYKGYPCGVGSGFSDVDREYIWNNQDEYLGKIVELQYFEESKNNDGGLSLRFPVFKGLRTDKTEESYN